jgi:hypothetical protein
MLKREIEMSFIIWRCVLAVDSSVGRTFRCAVLERLNAVHMFVRVAIPLLLLTCSVSISAPQSATRLQGAVQCLLPSHAQPHSCFNLQLRHIACAAPLLRKAAGADRSKWSVLIGSAPEGLSYEAMQAAYSDAAHVRPEWSERQRKWLVDALNEAYAHEGMQVSFAPCRGCASIVGKERSDSPGPR